MNVTYMQIAYYSIAIIGGTITLSTWIYTRYKKYRQNKQYSPKQKQKYYNKVLNDKHAPPFRKRFAKDRLKQLNKKQ